MRGFTSEKNHIPAQSVAKGSKEVNIWRFIKDTTQERNHWLKLNVKTGLVRAHTWKHTKGPTQVRNLTPAQNVTKNLTAMITWKPMKGPTLTKSHMPAPKVTWHSARVVISRDIKEATRERNHLTVLHVIRLLDLTLKWKYMEEYIQGTTFVVVQNVTKPNRDKWGGTVKMDVLLWGVWPRGTRGGGKKLLFWWDVISGWPLRVCKLPHPKR